ncbi:MAG: hypothetical protein LBK25_02830 [Treponema sp.]|nr:hypothetical protein [Treponema sp.]
MLKERSNPLLFLLAVSDTDGVRHGRCQRRGGVRHAAGFDTSGVRHAAVYGFWGVA